MIRHNPGLILEARQLREFHWTQQQIADTLKVPQPTISRWLNNGYSTLEEMSKRHTNIHNGTPTLSTPITLYPYRYEEVGDRIPPESIDLILTDPPYLASSTDMPRKNQKVLQRDFGNWDNVPQKQYTASVYTWAKLMYWHLKAGGSLYLFTSHRQISVWSDALGQAGLSDNGLLIWHRINPAPQIRKTRWCPAFDLILFYSKQSPRIFRWIGQNEMHNVIVPPDNTITGIITGPICLGNERQWHPTQKPRWLLEKLLFVSSEPGSQILDPFAGSGSTAFAASRLPERHTTLVEPEPKYVGLIQSIARDEFRCEVKLETI